MENKITDIVRDSSHMVIDLPYNWAFLWSGFFIYKLFVLRSAQKVFGG